MSKNRVYAAVEIADQEVRLVVMEIYEARNNVLRVERIPCSGVQDQKIVDEAAVVTAVRQACTNATAALGFRIERVLLAIPSVNVQRSNQKVHIQIEDGTKNIRIFHIQQGYQTGIQKRLGDSLEFVNANRISYIVNGVESTKLPLSESCEDFYMDIDLLFADKETLFAYARCIEQANLEILDVCVDSYAMAQQTGALFQDMSRPAIQIDLEKEHATLSVFQGGRLVTSMVLNRGYNWFIEPLAYKYDLTDDIRYRLLQNLFTAKEEEAGDEVVYIEAKPDMRVEITAKELAESVLPRIRQWIAEVNETCLPIIRQSNRSKYILSGQGSNFIVMNRMLKAFNANASLYHEESIGARDGAYVTGLGMAYAWQSINRIRRNKKISANKNELEASIDSINQRARDGEGGFTKKLKSVILTERD